MEEPKAAWAHEGAVLAAMASAVARADRTTPHLTGGIPHIWLNRTSYWGIGDTYPLREYLRERGLLNPAVNNNR